MAWARARYTRAARAETTTAGIVARLQTALNGAETPAERANLQAVIEHLQSLRTHAQEREEARAELELAAPAMTRTTNRALLAHARALHDPSASPAAVEAARAAASDAQTVAEALRKVADMLAD